MMSISIRPVRTFLCGSVVHASICQAASLCETLTEIIGGFITALSNSRACSLSQSKPYAMDWSKSRAFVSFLASMLLSWSRLYLVYGTGTLHDALSCKLVEIFCQLRHFLVLCPFIVGKSVTMLSRIFHLDLCRSLRA